jgi:predicted permease
MKSILDGIKTVPGVEAAAISATVPGTATNFPMEIKITDAAVAPDRQIIADEKVVYGKYFEALRIPLLAGSSCKEDTMWSTALVNRSFVETYFPDQPIIGHHLAFTAWDDKPAVIGIVADAREDGLNHEPVPTVYWCSPNANPSPYFLIRTHGDPMQFATALRRKVHEAAPDRSVFDIMPLAEHLSDSNQTNRFRTSLLTSFALTAILLAAIGLYGTLSYLVARRNREIGLRMALGALPGEIRARFLAQGGRVALLGCVAGLVLAASFSRVLAGMLYGVSRLDAATYFGVAAGVLAIAALACAIPASRAARLDPMQVLRHE